VVVNLYIQPTKVSGVQRGHAEEGAAE